VINLDDTYIFDMTLVPPTGDGPSIEELAVLEHLQQRVLWLAVSMIHHANKVRSATSEVKVGGHQASSASIVSIMTSLYFHHLNAQDRVSVKPHAAPVLHAINYMMGRLDPKYLTELRAYRGLQSYPSRTKDPDPVDFSTGSVGIGATATIWSALAHRYVTTRFEAPPAGRHIALIGDAELDEGAIWEALVDPMVARLSEVLWIVDLNRQSLDRVVPDIAARRFEAMFAAVGWHTITVKYGSRLRELFGLDGGEVLQQRIDEMTNGEYQRLLRTPPRQVRDLLAGDGHERRDLLRVLDGIEDETIVEAIRALGGHDLGDLINAFQAADQITDRPTVIFAYTVKAWGLPTQGHPENHSAVLSTEQWRELGGKLNADPEDPWALFPHESEEGRRCAAAAVRLTRSECKANPAINVPVDFKRSHLGAESTQQAFGRFFLDVLREAPDVADRVVTVSADVASSTNLGGWINRIGIWNPEDRPDWFAESAETLLHWRESKRGQHIELGIAEVNLVGLLSELGLTWSRDGEPLFPIGSIYDPFVGRALEPWSFGMYAGGQSILVGTPSGITLAPEGGAHQSVITPSIGIEQPQCVAWEPAFSQDLEWALLWAFSRLGQPDGTSSYFRLSTRPMDQELAGVPVDPIERENRRNCVLSGGYRLRTAVQHIPDVTLVGTGVVMTELMAAALELEQFDLECDVICLTSADLIFRAFQARQGLAAGDDSILTTLFPVDRAGPIVSVLDGHPHTLSFLAGINATPIACLGVDDFGQSGDIDALYSHFGIDISTIVGAALDLIDAKTNVPVDMRLAKNVSSGVSKYS